MSPVGVTPADNAMLARPYPGGFRLLSPRVAKVSDSFRVRAQILIIESPSNDFSVEAHRLPGRSAAQDSRPCLAFAVVGRFLGARYAQRRPSGRA